MRSHPNRPFVPGPTSKAFEETAAPGPQESTDTGGQLLGRAKEKRNNNNTWANGA